MTFRTRGKAMLHALPRSIYAALLAWFTMEILLRRWIWSQIPTQVSPVQVYTALLLNCFVLWMLLRPRVHSAKQTKRKRN